MYRNNVVWELRASKTDELITTFNNKSLEDFEFSKQPEEIQKRIKEIVLGISDFNGFDENDFDEWYYYQQKQNLYEKNNPPSGGL